MAKPINTPPDELRDYLISKDGVIWWNPEAKLDKRCKTDKPIGLPTKSKNPCFKFQGKFYGVARINYWFHSGEYPECVLFRDGDSTNIVFSNLIGTTEANKMRMIHMQRESSYHIVMNHNKNCTTYTAYFETNRKRRVIGTFDNEDKAIYAAKLIRNFLWNEAKELASKVGLITQKDEFMINYKTTENNTSG